MYFALPYLYPGFAHVQTILIFLCEQLSHLVHLCLFLDVYFSHMIFPLAQHNISVVCKFLSSSFLTAQDSASYTMARCIAVLYTLSFNCVCMFIMHITLVVDMLSCPQLICDGRPTLTVVNCVGC